MLPLLPSECVFGMHYLTKKHTLQAQLALLMRDAESFVHYGDGSYGGNQKLQNSIICRHLSSAVCLCNNGDNFE